MIRTSALVGCLAIAGLVASNVRAGLPLPIVHDGTVDGTYGGARSVQNTNTQFGNATQGDPVNGGGGSEIDGVYAVIDGGRLYVTIAGNLEPNFNKLEVFIDSVAGGVNQIDGDQLPGGVDGFCCGGFVPPNGGNADNIGALQRMDGLTFDAGFGADHFLTFSNGFETATNSNITFWAITAHYADLTQGTAGRTAALGMQLAPYGMPNVLRGTTGDIDIDGTVDGGEFLQWQRNVNRFDGATTIPTRTDGDANADNLVNGGDLAVIEATFGFDVQTTGFDGFLFAPQNAVDDSNVLIGPALPGGLNQGDLIDKHYALGDGGCTDASGAGCVTEELEFALPVDPADAGNTFSHRNMDNIVDLKMAFNNSNVVGVTGDAPYTDPTAGNPGDVQTGLEFSIPLSQLGNPTGDIKIFAFINGNGHDYASNQFSGIGILESNLGGNGFGGFTGDLSGVNLTDFAGDQFVTVPAPPALNVGVVPEPTTGLLALLAGLGLLPARRR